uniref:Uncharacterized protein n=1 Tax=Oryza brachyantha TaxID=4533 RepID=J3N1V2_ORYBR
MVSELSIHGTSSMDALREYCSNIPCKLLLNLGGGDAHGTSTHNLFDEMSSSVELYEEDILLVMHMEKVTRDEAMHFLQEELREAKRRQDEKLDQLLKMLGTEEARSEVYEKREEEHSTGINSTSGNNQSVSCLPLTSPILCLQARTSTIDSSGDSKKAHAKWLTLCTDFKGGAKQVEVILMPTRCSVECLRHDNRVLATPNCIVVNPWPPPTSDKVLTSGWHMRPLPWPWLTFWCGVDMWLLACSWPPPLEDGTVHLLTIGWAEDEPLVVDLCELFSHAVDRIEQYMHHDFIKHHLQGLVDMWHLCVVQFPLLQIWDTMICFNFYCARSGSNICYIILKLLTDSGSKAGCLGPMAGSHFDCIELLEFTYDKLVQVTWFPGEDRNFLGVILVIGWYLLRLNQFSHDIAFANPEICSILFSLEIAKLKSNGMIYMPTSSREARTCSIHELGTETELHMLNMSIKNCFEVTRYAKQWCNSATTIFEKNKPILKFSACTQLHSQSEVTTDQSETNELLIPGLWFFCTA